jgi:hypothetical protein
MSNGDGVETYHGEIGREATAVAEMLSHPRQPTTGQSVGKPSSQMRMEAESGDGCDLGATAANAFMRNGESP